MCTRTNVDFSTLSLMVSELVSGLVDSNFGFSAYDITKALREDNPTIEIDRNEVKSAINSMHRRGEISPDYVRTTKTAPTGQTYLWYHNVNDADNTNSVSAPVVNKNTVADDVVEITKESRLNIPQKVLKSVGMNSGDVVSLCLDSFNTQPPLLTKTDIVDAIKYTINASGELRISQTHLVKQSGVASQFYKVYANGQDIFIEPVK